jgi:hypothetical protein
MSRRADDFGDLCVQRSVDPPAVGQASLSWRSCSPAGLSLTVPHAKRTTTPSQLGCFALLPLATGTGILALLGGHSVPAAIGAPVGVFGMVATISLSFYELHGVEKCAHYIYRGAQLEEDLNVLASGSAQVTRPAPRPAPLRTHRQGSRLPEVRAVPGRH